jgi:hypothetical protein
MFTARVIWVITPQPLQGKIAEIKQVNDAVRWLKVGASAVFRLGAIGTQPVVGYYFKVFVINVAIGMDVRSQAIACVLNRVAVWRGGACQVDGGD